MGAIIITVATAVKDDGQVVHTSMRHRRKKKGQVTVNRVNAEGTFSLGDHFLVHTAAVIQHWFTIRGIPIPSPLVGSKSPHCPKGNLHSALQYNMKFSGKNVRGIDHLVSRFPLLFMLYRGNLDCFSNSAVEFFLVPKVKEQLPGCRLTHVCDLGRGSTGNPQWRICRCLAASVFAQATVYKNLKSIVEISHVIL